MTNFPEMIILYAIQGFFGIAIAIGGFIMRGINQSIDRIETRSKEYKGEISILVAASKIEIEKRYSESLKFLDIKSHDNEKRIERLEDNMKDQDQNHAAFRENAAEKYATRQELKDATQQITATLVRLEQKIDALGDRQRDRRTSD